MIPYGRQNVSDDDVRAVTDVLRGDWLSTGPSVEAFEAALQVWTGGTPAVAVSSGTAALHTAYAAAGLGKGDEVITPPITFVATQAALVQVGATPVFADVESDTANIDPKAVEAAVGPRTAAVVAVDYAGHPADLHALRQIADKHKLLLIEDAAHSLGSEFGERPVGSLADLTTFSFFPTKNITTGEGGAVVSPHADLLERARLFSRQGLVRDPAAFLLPPDGPWHQEVHQLGLNYRLSDIHAILGLSQLRKLETFRQARADIKTAYDAALGPIPAVQVPAQRSNVRPTWHLYPLRVAAELRKAVYDQLLRQGFRCQVNYLPAYRHPALSHLAKPSEFPNSERFYSQELSLPLFVGLTQSQVSAVALGVKRAVWPSAHSVTRCD